MDDTGRSADVPPGGQAPRDAGDADVDPAPAGTTTEPGGAQDAEEGTRADEERLRAVVDELRRLRVDDLALDMAVSLVTVGYQKLGLTEQTRELRDLAGARLSIELLRAVLEVLEREGAAARLGDLRATLAAMQLNYARVAAEPPADAAAAPDGPPA